MEAFYQELGDRLELLLEHRGKLAVFLFPAPQFYPPTLTVRAIAQKDNTSRRRKQGISVDSHFSGVEWFRRRGKTSPSQYSNGRTCRLKSTAMPKQTSRSWNASGNHFRTKETAKQQTSALWSDNLRRFGDLRSASFNRY